MRHCSRSVSTAPTSAQADSIQFAATLRRSKVAALNSNSNSKQLLPTTVTWFVILLGYVPHRWVDCGHALCSRHPRGCFRYSPVPSSTRRSGPPCRLQRRNWRWQRWVDLQMPTELLRDRPHAVKFVQQQVQLLPSVLIQTIAALCAAAANGGGRGWSGGLVHGHSGHRPEAATQARGHL